MTRSILNQLQHLRGAIRYQRRGEFASDNPATALAELRANLARIEGQFDGLIEQVKEALK